MKRAEIEFIKDQIKQTLSLKEIVEFYVGQPNTYTKRYKCPFNHEENHCNLEVKEKYWRCFSCGDSGDEILFVQKLFNLPDYPSALLRICADFNLKTTTEFDNDFYNKVAEFKRQKQLREKEQRELALTERVVYNHLLNRQEQLEQIIAEHEPHNPNKLSIYSYTKHPDYVMKAHVQWKKNETLIDVLLCHDLSDYDSAIYGWEDDKKELKKQILHDIMNGQIKINKKGDVISVYGYK